MNTKDIYLDVVEDVIGQCKQAFAAAGVDETVLQELKARWQLKINGNGATENLWCEETIEQMSKRARLDLENSLRIGQLDGDTTESDSYEEEEPMKPVDLESNGSTLNTEDDVTTDEYADDVSENIIVCQYKKVRRHKNMWKMDLVNGIMCLNGTDFIFKQAKGGAIW